MTNPLKRSFLLDRPTFINLRLEKDIIINGRGRSPEGATTSPECLQQNNNLKVLLTQVDVAINHAPSRRLKSAFI